MYLLLWFGISGMAPSLDHQRSYWKGCGSHGDAPTAAAFAPIGLVLFAKSSGVTTRHKNRRSILSTGTRSDEAIEKVCSCFSALVASVLASGLSLCEVGGTHLIVDFLRNILKPCPTAYGPWKRGLGTPGEVGWRSVAWSRRVAHLRGIFKKSRLLSSMINFRLSTGATEPSTRTK